MAFVLILIYSNFVIVSEPRESMDSCLVEARSRVGEAWRPLFWDNMGGSNPIPKISVAFCVRGATL